MRLAPQWGAPGGGGNGAGASGVVDSPGVMLVVQQQRSRADLNPSIGRRGNHTATSRFLRANGPALHRRKHIQTREIEQRILYGAQMNLLPCLALIMQKY